MPGGQVEEGESLAQAAVREVKEESGIEIEVTKFCGIYQNTGKSICNTLFLGRPIGGICTPSERIESYLDEAQHPFYVAF